MFFWINRRFFGYIIRMEKLLKEAQGLQENLVAWRRYLHKNAELGFDLPKTAGFVESALKEMG